MKTKKITAVLLILAILSSFIPNLISNAATDNPSFSMTVSGSSATTVEAEVGDTVSIDLTMIDGIEDQKQLSAILVYDTTMLEAIPDDYDVDGTTPVWADSLGTEIANFNYGTETTEGIVLAYYAMTGKLATSGSMGTIQFKVLQAGTSTIDFTIAKYSIGTAADEGTEYTINKSVTVTVPVAMTGLTVTPDSASLTKGQTTQLTATKEPANTTDTTDITWKSSNTSVATVDSNGLVTATGSGTATITATCGNYSDTATITVTNPMTGLSMSESSLTIHKGNSATLTASKVPSDTDDTNAITWSSSDDSVATVSDGVVSATGVGTATITATCGGFSATCTVTVDSPLESLTLNATEVGLDKDETYTLTATKNPADTTDTNTITWSSSDDAVATVDSAGVVTGVSIGTATITATCGSVTATCTVTVNVHLESITIDQGDSIEVKKDQTTPLTITYNPTEFAESKAITWTSDDEDVAVITTDEQGNTVVKGIAPGTATITATSVNGLTDTITVTVPTVNATDVAVSTTATTIEKGDTYQLTAELTPEDTTDTFTWKSSDETVATVDQTGLVTAVASGTAEITITSDSDATVTDTCTVTVVCTLQSISLNLTSIDLVIGGTEESDTLVVTKNPTDADPDLADVVYTSDNEDVAKVENGKIVAVGPGSTVITATLAGKTATCNVTVDVALTSVDIENSDTTLELIKNQTGALNVVYTPSNATIIPTASWSSSDEAVVTVDENGNLTAVSAGTATITVDYGNGITATRNVEVVEKASSSIVIDQADESLDRGSNLSLSVTLDENSTDEITWTSSDDSIATVDSTGNVTALKAGTVTITASSNLSSEVATLTLAIKEVALQSAKITSSASTVQEGSGVTVSMEYNPSYFTDSISLKYVSSDESIATVDPAGRVTALKAGTVKITAYVTSTAGDGTTTELTSAVSLTVTEKTTEVVAGTSTDAGSSTSTGDSGSVAETVAAVASGVTASPHTGDMNITALLALMIISLLGMVITVKKK